MTALDSYGRPLPQHCRARLDADGRYKTPVVADLLSSGIRENLF